MKNFRKGFTLLEILLVVGIIAIRAGIVIVAINPSKQLATVRNTERKSDIKTIYNAINQYYIDNSRYPASLTSVLTEVCDTDTATSSHNIDCTGMVDLSELVPKYLVAIPKDPKGPVTTAFLNKIINTVYAATGGTGYYVMKDPTNKVILNTERAELGVVVAIGTTTAMVVEEEVVDYSCGDPTLEECWSNSVPGYTWSTYEALTGINSTTDGSSNTDALATLGSAYEAATYCAELIEGDYPAGTWYLPAIDQLEDGIVAQLAGVGTVTGFNGMTNYWSSTENSSDNAWAAWYAYGEYGVGGSGKYNSSELRCLR